MNIENDQLKLRETYKELKEQFEIISKSFEEDFLNKKPMSFLNFTNYLKRDLNLMTRYYGKTYILKNNKLYIEKTHRKLKLFVEKGFCNFKVKTYLPLYLYIELFKFKKTKELVC